jgi:hypothetical protein
VLEGVDVSEHADATSYGKNMTASSITRSFGSNPSPLEILEKQHPDLHAIIREVPFVDVDYATPTMAWDGRRILVSELFGARMDEEQTVYAIAFMALLVRQNGIDRLGTKDARLWSLACNHVAHCELHRRGLPGIRSEMADLDSLRFDGMSEIAVYGRLVDEERPIVEMIDLMTGEDLRDATGR